MSAVIYPTTNLKATEQLCIERGEGVYVYDNQGKQYLEGLSGLWCTSLGYGNEELIETTVEQMRNLTYSHMFGGKTHQVGIDLARKIADMVPVKDAKVFFGSSGSDANDTQIKLINYWANATGKTSKTKIISRDRAYHGVTVASACLTGLAPNHTHFNLPFDALGVLRTDAPHFYRQGLPGETEEQFSDRLMNRLELLIAENGAENIAAMIVEPINGAGGVIVPPRGYFEKLQTLLARHDIMLWSDEVITGFGRTGNDFGCNTFDFVPDMMSLAKALSSAYIPISAAVINGEMYEALVEPSAEIGAFGHGYTYSGHPVATAVALKTLEIYQRDNVFAKAATTGEYMMDRLQALETHPLVGEVRGRGLLAAVELVANKNTRQAFSGGSVGAFAQQACQDNGLIVRAIAGSSLGICPPLIITQAQVDELFDKLVLSLNQTLDHVQQRRLLVA